MATDSAIIVVFNRIPEIAAQLPEKAASALDQIAQAVLENATMRLQEPYPPASSPGESPHLRTGELAGEVEVRQPADLEREVAWTSDHAMPLEFGTVNMGARPFATPAAEAVFPEAERYLEGLVE